MRIIRVVFGTVAVLVVASSVLAQDRKPLPRSEMDKYVISAKAGVVNLVEGDARVVRALPFAIPQILLSGDELQNGDTVKTGETGRTEILLNPGCYLRLGAQSEFVFLFDEAKGDRLRLAQGSAVLEASAIEAPMIVETPKAIFEIARDGLYRFNINPDGKADVAVRKGRVRVGETTIKQGKRALVAGSTAVMAKLNKRETDVLDDWSKGRSKALIAANSRLSNVGMSRTLGMSFMRNTWIYDPLCRCYTFLPFAGGFSSPYGWNYAVCNPFGYGYYYRPRYNNGGSTGGGRGGGTTIGGGGTATGGGKGSGSDKGAGRGKGSGGGDAVGGGSGGRRSRDVGGGAGAGGGFRQPPSSPSIGGSTGGGGNAGRGAGKESRGPRRP